jgi:hypothetical protein
MSGTRGIRLFFQSPYAEGKGLLASDPRVRTLRRVLITYPEVRHILPDRISLDAGADPRTLDMVARFLERQHWLIKSVMVE